MVNDPVLRTRKRPLKTIAIKSGDVYIPRGVSVPALDKDILWEFQPKKLGRRSQFKLIDALVKLSNCVASPLSNWALEIATALCVIRTEDANVLWALFPSASEEANENLIMDRILMSSKKTRLHEDVLQIIFLRLDPILPLPRVRMLSVMFYIMYLVSFLLIKASIGPSLNELCLGLSAAEVAPQALLGVYAKYVHVRVACLNAVKCVPALAGHSIPEIIEVATSIWLAFHVLTDTHPKVESAGQTALQQVGSVIKNS
nr:eIF-2-alpha kinase activator GCN1 isoform X17 [Ipomoea batatas]